MAQDALTGHAGAIQELACRWLPIVAGGSGEGAGTSRAHAAGLWLALAAAAAGAGGETAEELRKLLGTAGPEAAGAVTEAARAVAGTDAVAVATGVWARTPVYRSYRESLPDIGFGQLDPADLSAIDDWVREATGGLIERLPAEPGPGTLLLLVNAIVLRARWAEPFEPHATHHRPFTDASGVREPVPTMWKRVPLADAWTVGASRVVELRCRADGGRPGARVRFVLGEPGREAGAVLADAWAAPALRGPVDAEEVEISLPRLSLRTRLEVTDHLAALGIARSASDAADFSVMSPERLKIGEVAQEAVLRIAEKGVEAAAATLVAMAPGGAAPVRRVERIRFDRPFGIVVLDAAGEVPLFTAWQAAVPRDPLPGPYELTEHDPDPDAVRRITFVPFLPDGRCALIDDGDLVLPSGEVLPGEHWLLDTSVRVPMETAGFRPQRVHPFAYDAERQHLFVWLEGDRYTGPRPHADAALVAEPPEALAGVLLPGTDLTAALDAARSYRAQSDASYFADNVRLLEPAYLRGRHPRGRLGLRRRAAGVAGPPLDDRRGAAPGRHLPGPRLRERPADGVRTGVGGRAGPVGGAVRDRPRPRPGRSGPAAAAALGGPDRGGERAGLAPGGRAALHVRPCAGRLRAPGPAGRAHTACPGAGRARRAGAAERLPAHRGRGRVRRRADGGGGHLGDRRGNGGRPSGNGDDGLDRRVTSKADGARRRGRRRWPSSQTRAARQRTRSCTASRTSTRSGPR